MRADLNPPPLGEVGRRRRLGGGIPSTAKAPTVSASRCHLPQRGRI